VRRLSRWPISLPISNSAAHTPGRMVVYIGWARQMNRPAPRACSSGAPDSIEPDSPVRRKTSYCYGVFSRCRHRKPILACNYQFQSKLLLPPPLLLAAAAAAAAATTTTTTTTIGVIQHTVTIISDTGQSNLLSLRCNKAYLSSCMTTEEFIMSRSSRV